MEWPFCCTFWPSAHNCRPGVGQPWAARLDRMKETWKLRTICANLAAFSRRTMTMDKQIQSFFRYFLVARRDRDWALYITTVGASQIGPGIGYPPLGHPKTYSSVTVGRTLPEFVLVYISAGTGWFKSTSVPKQRIEAGHVMMLFPAERHRDR